MMDKLKNTQEGEIKVSVAGLEDLEAYKDIRIEALTVNPEAFGGTLEEALSKTDEYWKDRLQRQDLFIVLAKTDATPKGAQSITGAREREEEKGIWKIIAVYTRPEFRGRGLQQRVLQMVLEEIKRRGGIKAALNVTARPEQEAARGVYQKLGFREVKRAIEEGEEVIKMELELTR